MQLDTCSIFIRDTEVTQATNPRSAMCPLTIQNTSCHNNEAMNSVTTREQRLSSTMSFVLLHVRKSTVASHRKYDPLSHTTMDSMVLSLESLSPSASVGVLC